MDISEARRKSSGDLIDRVAHDGGLVDGDRHVRGNALRPNGTALHALRHEDERPEDVASHAGKEAGLDAVEHAIHYANGKAAMATKAAKALGLAEGTAEVVGIGWLACDAFGALSDAEEKAEEIRRGFDNDAVNCAIAGNLAFDPAFAALEQAARPGVVRGTSQISEGLRQQPAIRAVLQARADEGYLAAERALAETSHLPPEQRAEGLHDWFKARYGTRLFTDVAFAKGVEYHAFVTSAAARHLYGIDAAAELKKVEDRAPIERPLMVQP